MTDTRYNFLDIFCLLGLNSQYILYLLPFRVHLERLGRCLSAVSVYIGVGHKDLDYIAISKIDKKSQYGHPLLKD